MSEISDVAIPLDAVQPAEYDFIPKKRETMIAFDDEQMDFILAYTEKQKCETVQDAIMDALHWIADRTS